MNIKSRRYSGALTAEAAAVLTVALPLLALLAFVATELAELYTIKSAMEVGARNAARGLMVNYNNTGVKSTTVNFLTLKGYIASSNQFQVAWDSANPPNYVTVSCAYPTAGGNGLRPFPWGPLRFLGRQNAAFSLGAFSVTGSFTLPIQ